MMRSASVWLAAAVLAMAPACGDDGPDNPGFADARPGPDARVTVDSGPTPDAPEGIVDAAVVVDAQMDADGPGVEVLSPTEPPAGNYDSDEIVVDDRFTALCRVTANANSGDPVDTGSVRIEVFGDGGQMVQAVAAPTTVANEYKATVSVIGFRNGPLTVRCTASDLADPPRQNSDEHVTYLDLGPEILVFSPTAGASIANAVEVVFRVNAAPVATGDSGATPNGSSVTMSIAGVDLTGDLTEDPAGSGVYKATVNFEDARFVPSLDGPQTLTVTAANTRSPTPVTRVEQREFIADSDGPIIDVTSPEPGEFIAGIFALTANISDPAGVDDSSVVATIAGTHDFPLFSVGMGTYAGAFDTRSLPSTMLYPTIVVRARDSVANQSSIGMVVTLDNQPPLASLDPPNLRESYYNAGRDLILCSKEFDPLGSDAVDDGQSVPQLSELRSRVEDLGNGATTAGNGMLLPSAGVNPDRVQLFVLDDSDKALLVDTDGDTICDDINPNLIPTSVPMASNEAAVIDLGAVAEDGISDFNPPIDPPSAPAGCDVEVDPVPVPTPLCQVTSPLTRIIKAEIGEDAVIYSIPPVTDLQCVGNPMDSVATNISDGWACAAVRAVDNVGNVGISPPLRLCIDADGDEAECPTWGTVTTSGLPDCTGTYNPSTGVTDASTDCTIPESFADFPGLQLRRRDL